MDVAKVRHGLSDIAERGAQARSIPACAWGETSSGVYSRCDRGRRGGIAAMVGSQNRQVFGTQRGAEFRQPASNSSRIGVAFQSCDAVLLIEIDQITKTSRR